MEIERWLTVNVFFNKSERKRADALIKRYIARGYTSNGEDDGDPPYELCTQLVSWSSFKEDMPADRIKKGDRK